MQLKCQHLTLLHSPPNFPQQQKRDHRLLSCNLITIPQQHTHTQRNEVKKKKKATSLT